MADVAALSGVALPADPTGAAQAARKSYVDARPVAAHVATHRAGGTDELLLTVATKTASYTLTSTDDVVVFNTASGAATATLPTAVGRAGKRYVVKKLGGTTANPLTIASAGGTIDGAATEVISVAGGFREVVSDGTNWHIISGRVEPVIVSLASVGTGGTIAIDASVGSTYRVTTTGATATLAVPTNPIDDDNITVQVLAQAALSLTLNASIVNCSGRTFPASVAAGKRLFLGLRTVGTTWYLLAAAPEP